MIRKGNRAFELTVHEMNVRRRNGYMECLNPFYMRYIWDLDR